MRRGREAPPEVRPTPTGAALIGLLAAPNRLRVVAAIVLGAATPGRIAAQAGLTEAEVTTALTRLVRSGRRTGGWMDGLS